jgi:hypothetical protein
MGQKRALTRGRVIALLIAGGAAGYATTSSYLGVSASDDGLSAAQAVALRFPEGWTESQAAADEPDVGVISDPRFALLSPEPMMQSVNYVPAADAGTDGAAVAAAAPVVPAPVANADAVTPPAKAAPQPLRTASVSPSGVSPSGDAKVNPAALPAAVRHKAERPGFVLNDAQIASIKERLHLTADQEHMWPAVEAALRNLAYVRARDAHRHGPATATQVASADPNSIEVQGLKSAAIPLLMSFNAEQKDEVRNIAHVMGLDQLADQF